MLSSYHIEQKHLSKQVVPITYTLETQLSLLKVYWSFLFKQTKKMWYTLVCLSLFCISRGKKDYIDTARESQISFSICRYLV